MRTAFINHLNDLAATHSKLFLVVGDLGYSVVEGFSKKFPDRFLNAGVAEQNMTGVASGLASEGFHVFTYSIANFPTLRCLEQIRNDICYHDLPVTIVSVGAGLAYGSLGYSHHAVQDIAIMRTMPGLMVFSPCDPGEVVQCLDYIVANPGPSYLRLGKAGEKVLHAVAGIEEGPLCIRSGLEEIAFIATGSIVSVALKAAAELDAVHSKKVAVYSCPLLTPKNIKFYDELRQYKFLISIEEHVEPGGFGELLTVACAPRTEVIRASLTPEAFKLVGSQEYLRARSGLTAAKLISLFFSIKI